MGISSVSAILINKGKLIRPIGNRPAHASPHQGFEAGAAPDKARPVKR